MTSVMAGNCVEDETGGCVAAILYISCVYCVTDDRFCYVLVV